MRLTEAATKKKRRVKRTELSGPTRCSPATGLNLQPIVKFDIVISSVLNITELAMAQFIVRNLEDDVKARLKRRATHHGRSMEEEVRHILRDAVKEQNQRVAKLGSRIAARFANRGSP